MTRILECRFDESRQRFFPGVIPSTPHGIDKELLTVKKRNGLAGRPASLWRMLQLYVRFQENQGNGKNNHPDEPIHCLNQ